MRERESGREGGERERVHCQLCMLHCFAAVFATICAFRRLRQRNAKLSGTNARAQARTCRHMHARKKKKNKQKEGEKRKTIAKTDWTK